MLSSGRNRKTSSHSVAGAISSGTGKPGSRLILPTISSGGAIGASPISPRGAASAGRGVVSSTAVAARALLDDDGAERIRQLLGRRLAHVPVVPFLGREELLHVVGDRVIVALARDEGRGPSGEPPVDVFVGLVEGFSGDFPGNP